MNAEASVEYTDREGPYVKVQINGIEVKVYLATHIARVATSHGSFNIAIAGQWGIFEDEMRIALGDVP